ncbi:MFS transporter, DHA1 family, bicyclomycin/chloramphenicol resistance protein [Pedobacter westerhofensis]|uniref:MFS transporter, DHA1 family, bicyclomycin/chloramphenicol resistance protein n=1 Tax=Pedobacter westerhofensis TaxID=425512 RepID=A0A521FHT9_9SPHI|nr:multidrug effflux MFS transporter [Pedobacter westerhofensis]SMO95782.1 MFS transporter, DHA1 family, bicyclomycin/chloramphenicol resistance protein [Pedobacter westerhofensis]
MTKKRHFFLILLLGSLTALGPFSIDMYLPGFPAIASDLHTTVAKVSLSLSGFFIGISAGQLLYGPLLDRFGRKKPLYIGLMIYILASVGCAYASTINMLIILRCVQAIGSCAAAVASIAMVRDLFPVSENAKVFALLMLVVGVSPMIAPTVGGYVTTAFGWHSVFIVLMVLGLINLLASIFGLPDSYKPDSTISLKPKPILKNFLTVLTEPQFYTYALTGAVAFSGLFAYVAGSPLLFMDIFAVKEETYGWIFAFLSIGLIGSSQVNTLLLRKYSSEQLIFAALICQAITGLVFLLGSFNGWFGLPETIFLLFIFLSCLGVANPNTSALSLTPFTKNAGSASALMGAIQMGLGTLASIGVSMFDTRSSLPLVSIMASTSLLALTILYFGRKTIKNKVEADKDGAVAFH